MTQRFCRICEGWHDLDEPWPERCRGYNPATSSVQIIKDIEPYQSVAADKETGKPVLVGGRRQHREFLKRNNYVEVGNEYKNWKPTPPPMQEITGRDVKEAIDQLRNRK